MTSRTKHGDRWKNEHRLDLESCINVILKVSAKDVQPEIFLEAEKLISRLANVTYKSFLSDVVDKYRHIKSEEEAGLILHLMDESGREREEAKLKKVNESIKYHLNAYREIVGKSFNAEEYKGKK